jgi:hypothetical protein
MRIGIIVFMSIAAESFLVYALFHFIRESIPVLRTARTRTTPAGHGARPVLPLEFIGPVSSLVWSASGWNNYVHEGLAMTQRASARRR